MDVLVVNVVLDFHPISDGKPIANHLRILLEYFLAVLRSVMCYIKLVRTLYDLAAQFLPPSFPPHMANSLSAISATSYSWGANPRESRSRIYWIIICSLVVVSFRQFS